MKRRVSGSIPQEKQRKDDTQTAMQARMPWALGYGFVLLIWLTSRFLLLPAGEISAEFTTLLFLSFLLLMPLPWQRVPPTLTLFTLAGGVVLGGAIAQLVTRGASPSALAFLQALVIVVLAILPLIWSRITAVVSVLVLTGASLVNANGDMLLWRGGLLWLLGGMTALFLTLSFAAQYIAPPFNQEQNQTSFLGFRLLLINLFSDLSRKKKKSKHPASVPRSFSEILAGDIDSHEAYAVYIGPRYHAAAGPGYTLLAPGSRINDVYDVRPHLYTESFEATTRDGIRVESDIQVHFYVRRPEEPPDPHFPFRYDRSAIGKLQPTMIVDADGTERTIHPFAQVTSHGASLTIVEVSRRTLNQLMQPTMTESGEPRSALVTVGEIVCAELNQFFNPRGITVEHVEVHPFHLSKNVLDSRLEAWKRAWQARASKGKSTEAKLEKVSAETARAHLSVIEDLVENLKIYKEIGSSQLGDDLPGYQDMIRQIEQIIMDATKEGLLHTLLPDNQK